MPNLNLRRFSDPDTLCRIKPERLIEWLRPAEGYLATRGVNLRAAAADPAATLQALAAVFIDPQPGMPPSLVDSLHLIHEMADPVGMDAILDGAKERGLILELGDQPVPADVAVEAWLRAPALLEQLHNEHQLTRPRSFQYFVTDTDPVPPFTPPNPAQLAALQARLDEWFAAKKRGRGCRVFAYPKGRECWFLVRHGLPCKREGVMDGGDNGSVFYRPLKHDVLVYDSEAGELRINCCGSREREEFRRAFGSHIFGNEEFFPGTAKYTLAPLLTGRSSLACADIDGIDEITLKEVEFYHRADPWHRTTTKADDIFTLVEDGLMRWPAAERIARAGFEVQFSASGKSRRVTIIPSNKAQYGRDDDSLLVEKWIHARGFLVTEIETIKDAGGEE